MTDPLDRNLDESLGAADAAPPDRFLAMVHRVRAGRRRTLAGVVAAIVVVAGAVLVIPPMPTSHTTQLAAAPDRPTVTLRCSSMLALRDANLSSDLDDMELCGVASFAWTKGEGLVGPLLR